MEKSVLEKIQDPHVENKYNLTSTSKQYPAPQHGGRIPNIMDSSDKSLVFENGGFPYKQNGPSLFGDSTRRDLIGHIHKATPLNVVFFSDSNIDVIQKGIQDQVFAMSGNKYRVDRQSDDDVKIIMRSYYLSFGENRPDKVAENLADLNGRVIGYASAKVYSEVDFHMFYLKDLQEFASPIANPTNVRIYKVDELKSFF